MQNQQNGRICYEKLKKTALQRKKGWPKKKKKGAARAYRKNRPWRKKGRKKKKNQGERPFFWTEKKGALESNMPTEY